MFRLTKRRPPAPRPRLCIGHSHVACVARAAGQTRFPLQTLNFWDMPDATVSSEEGPRLTEAVAQRLREHQGTVFSMIGGGAHGVLGVLVHPRRFDFVLPEQPLLPLDPAAEILPALAVQQVLESLMSDYLALMSQVRQLSVGPMFHIESPPPYADAERMHADMPWSMFPGMCHEISPACFRYKLWRLHSQIAGKWCETAGVVFVPCPPETVDENGFMREPYYGDGAHANAAYGELVLEQMRQLT